MSHRDIILSNISKNVKILTHVFCWKFIFERKVLLALSRLTVPSVIKFINGHVTLFVCSQSASAFAVFGNCKHYVMRVNLTMITLSFSVLLFIALLQFVTIPFTV